MRSLFNAAIALLRSALSLLRGRVLAIVISSLLLLVTSLGVAFNEGVLSPFPEIEEDDRPSVAVFRRNCSNSVSEVRDRSSYPIVQVFSRPSYSDYFSSDISGTISLSFVGFFIGCSEIQLDFTELDGAKVHSAEVAVYKSDTSGSERYISRARYKVNWSASDKNRTSFFLPTDRDVAELDIVLTGLFQRAGSAEFYFDGHFRFFEVIDNEDVHSEEFVGGSFSRLVAIGLDQRTETSNPYDGGAPELVRTITFEKLESMNRFVSTFLATLLGIWVGLIFESILAMTILREVRSSLKGGSD